MTSCRFDNWDTLSEEIVNKQITIEYWASLQYHMMWSYFDRSDVGLKNIAEFFKKSSEEEREHAHKLMEYQNLRGGTVKIGKLEDYHNDYLKVQDHSDVLSSFIKALDMEQHVYKSLLEVHRVGQKVDDPQFTDFIEGEFLEEQVNAINEISKYISQLKRIGNDGHGIWNFDQEFKNH